MSRIPVLGMLFQSTTRSISKTRLYAFIRPVILRDDEFQDLRYLSERDVAAADLEHRDFPDGDYLWMR